MSYSTRGRHQLSCQPEHQEDDAADEKDEDAENEETFPFHASQ
jgi:hypothetical protein